jgi:hypothetical protein
VRNGVIKVPTGPGLGIEIDPDYLKKAQIVKAQGGGLRPTSLDPHLECGPVPRRGSTGDVRL